MVGGETAMLSVMRAFFRDHGFEHPPIEGHQAEGLHAAHAHPAQDHTAHPARHGRGGHGEDGVRQNGSLCNPSPGKVRCGTLATLQWDARASPRADQNSAFDVNSVVRAVECKPPPACGMRVTDRGAAATYQHCRAHYAGTLH